ncbi:uncharacterized protein [Onthophagus taurus]|uniref:uncharacterized protein n=1 Tax=Onthophagus taurus TaxID=166361 RepID=UPI0039BDAAF7
MDYYSATGSCVETVRALHQTIGSLKSALERSRNEILDLKSRSFYPQSEQNNLRDKQLTTSKIVSFSNVFDGDKQVSSSNSLRLQQKSKVSRKLPRFKEEIVDSKSKVICSENSNYDNAKNVVDVDKAKHLGHVIEAAINKISENHNKRIKKNAKRLKNNTKKNEQDEQVLCGDKEVKNKKQIEFSVEISKKPSKPININILTKYKKKKTKMDEDKSEKLEEHNLNDEEENINIVPPLDLTNLNDTEQEVDDIELIFTTEETKDTDFKEELVPIDTLLQCPLSDYDEKLSGDTSDRELEDDVFNDNETNQEENIHGSKSDNSIHDGKSLKSYYSFQDSSFENKSLEKDESFDRFEEKVRIVETDISKIGIQDSEYNLGRRNTCPNPIQYRPIMHREALGRGARKNRPFGVHVNVRKDSEAQTNISAIPGSSWRSESSLAHKVKIGDNFTTLPSKFPHPGSRLQLSEKTVEARRVLLSDIGFTSMVPELSRSADHLCPPVTRNAPPTSYGQFLRTTDLYSPAYTQTQRYLWTTTTPSDRSNSQSRYSSQFISSPPIITRRCSAPVSPSKRPLKMATSKVRFANGSLPELRSDWTNVDSGESTDSLVEEAEHYLRRSIDCLAPCHNVCFKSDSSKTIRRASAPEPCRDNVPPQGWQPFLPRIPRDLHLDYWVKVITAEGRVRGGRVRYVGPLLNQSDMFIGVQLSTPDGQSDGTHNNRRYFNCEPYHGLFIPFKKIIMGWRP